MGDTDGDGIVTADDLKDNLKSMLSNKLLSQKDKFATKKMLREVETKLKDKYAYTEFLAATFDRKKCLQEGACKAAFAAFDQDCDGFVTVEELATGSLLGNLKQSHLSKLVKDTDKNNDGEVDFAEFMLMMRRAA